MHRLPLIFVHKRRSDSKSSRRDRGAAADAAKSKPRLKRCNALKNIDFEPCTSPSSEDFLISLKWSDKKSFRIEGDRAEIETFFEELGFSGPEDFEIPPAAWEASMKARSPCHVLPRLCNSPPVEFSDSVRVTDGRFPVNGEPDNGTVTRFPGSCSVSSAFNSKIEANDSEFSEICRGNHRHIDRCVGSSSGTPLRGEICETVSRFDDSVAFNKTEPARFACDGGGGGGGGIKGVRPPVLTPPPAMPFPVGNDTLLGWGTVSSSMPVDDMKLGFLSLERMIADAEIAGKEGANIEVDEEVENDIRTQLGFNDLHSASCSFTTNDDDSSSTTTELMSIISPNGRFIRIITGWQKGQLLGRGSFGSVFEGIADGGFFFAVKEVSLLDQGDDARQSIHQLEQEIALLSQFEHDNIVQYFGTDKDDSKLYIFLELVSQGSLLSLYQKYHLRDSQVSAYTRQILLGLKYLHDRDVVHRDIKCANILVDAAGSVKLADFGLAKATKLNDVKSCKGTAFWMAPEVVNRRNSGYGLAADIWSLGCTVLEMLTRQFPYCHLEHIQALFKIGRGEPPHVPNTLSGDAQDFIHRCLQVDPNARPTASQLLDHPFVKHPLPSPLSSPSPRYLGMRF
nr:mitogen-activated protein kinase kinase kinase 1-like [Ipomoea batatas]